MFGADIGVIKLSRFINGVFKHLFGAGGQINFRGEAWAFTVANNKFNRVAGFGDRHAKFRQHASCYAFAFQNQAQQQMLGANVRMIKCACFFLGKAHHLFGTAAHFVVCTHIFCSIQR